MLWQWVEALHELHALQKTFCNDVYGTVWNYFQRSADHIVFCNDCTNANENDRFFLGMLQVFISKTATNIKQNATVAYTAQVVLLDFTPELR